MKRRKRVLAYISMMAVILIIAGFSLAIFQYNMTSSTSVSLKGAKMNLNITGGTLSTTGLTPTFLDGIENNSMVYNFNVTVSNNTNRQIKYDLLLKHSDDAATALPDEDYSFQLIEGDNIIAGSSLDLLSNDVMTTRPIAPNTSSETRYYTLYVYVNNHVCIGSDCETGYDSYSETDYGNKQANFKIAINGYQDKTELLFDRMIQDNLNANGNNGTIRDGTNDLYTVTSFTGSEFKYRMEDGKKYYYFRGSGVQNNYVVYGPFCWRIVRTTETGGIKLVFSGTAAVAGYNGDKSSCHYFSAATGNVTGVSDFDNKIGWSTDSSLKQYYTAGRVAKIRGSSGTSPVRIAESAVWDSSTSQYVLNNPITLSSSGLTVTQINNWLNNYPSYHYFCLDNKSTCQTVVYLQGFNDGFQSDIGNLVWNGIALQNGITVDQVIDQSYFNVKIGNSDLSGNVNSVYSLVKNNIQFGREYIDEYSEWCSDYSIANPEIFEQDISILPTYNSDLSLIDSSKVIKFGSVKRAEEGRVQFKCPVTPFTATNTNGNGKGTAGGLLTADEYRLFLGFDSNVNKSAGVFLMSPWKAVPNTNNDNPGQNFSRVYLGYSDQFSNYEKLVGTSGISNYSSATIYPAYISIVVKPYAPLDSGNGTMYHPYIISRDPFYDYHDAY